MPSEPNAEFIGDPQANMTTRDKNMYLSAKLSAAPYATFQIVRIERNESIPTGWWIYYF